MNKAIGSEAGPPPSVVLRPPLIFSLGAAALLMGFLTALGFSGEVVVAPLSVADGTYQTFGMLDRIAHGDLPGISQVPYLGILLSYALAPFYLAFGRSIFAAFAAAQLTVQISWFSAIAALFWASGLDRRSAVRLGANAFVVLYLFYLPLGMSGFFPELSHAYYPGNSLLFVRDSAGLILALATCGIADPARRHRLMAAGSGVLLFWSPSAGLALLVVSSLLHISREVASKDPLKARLARTAANLAATAVAFLATAALISAGHPFQLIDRVFLATGDNQFWFFAPFDDHSRLLSIVDVATHLVPTSWPVISMYIGLAAFAWNFLIAKPFSQRGDALVLISLTAFASGWISQVGGHTDDHYLYSFNCIGLANCIVLACRLWQRSCRQWPIYRYSYAIGMVLVLPGLRILFRMVRSFVLPLIHAGQPSASFWLPEAGMAFPQKAGKEVAFLRQQRAEMDHRGVPSDQRMLASYYAWPNVLVGSTHPPRFNSIIHLMTPADRRDFRDYLLRQRPEWVATLDVRREGFEYWNVRMNWPLYREIIKHYRPLYAGTAEVYWRRAWGEGVPSAQGAQPQGEKPVCRIVRVDSRRSELRVDGATPSSDVRILDLRVSYAADPGSPGGSRGDFGRGYVRVTDRSSGLVMQLRARAARGFTLPEATDAHGGMWYGLPSGRHTVELPMEHLGGQTSQLTFEVKGARSATITIDRCDIAEVLPDPFATIDSPGVITDLQ